MKQGLVIILIAAVLHAVNYKKDHEPKMFSIPGKTFDLDVVVVINKDVNKSYEIIRQIDTTARIEDFEARGLTFVNGGSIVVWMPEVQKEIVAHELLHATVAIMNWASVPLIDQTEEVYAYQLQYLTNEFYRNLK
jgi:hypothetical protein